MPCDASVSLGNRQITIFRYASYRLNWDKLGQVLIWMYDGCDVGQPVMLPSCVKEVVRGKAVTCRISRLLLSLALNAIKMGKSGARWTYSVAKKQY